MKTKLFFVLLLALAIVSMPSRVLAQADRGAIKGEVQDVQKANVPGAQLTLKNEATGVSASTVSSASGEFNLDRKSVV